MKPMQPVNGNILIKVDLSGEKVEIGGQELEVATKETREQRADAIAIRGTVMAVDAPHWDKMQALGMLNDKLVWLPAVGDYVVVSKWEPAEHTIAGEEHILTKPEYILMCEAKE